MDGYKEEIRQLSFMEGELLNLIADTEDETLMSKFLAWQKQRSKCNEVFIEYTNSLLGLKG